MRMRIVGVAEEDDTRNEEIVTGEELMKIYEVFLGSQWRRVKRSENKV